MRPIKINALVMMLVLMSGAVTWLLSVGYILIQTDLSAQQRTWRAAESGQQQLELQLIRKAHHFNSARDFPDFHLWKQTPEHAGLCASYRNAETQSQRSLCVDESTEEQRPRWFDALYHIAFEADKTASLPVHYKGDAKGTITITTGHEVELARAWQQVVNLSGLSLITVALLSLCLYIAMRRLLRPLDSINKTLLDMHHGDLTATVPNSHIAEWKTTGTRINQLALRLSDTLNERKDLSLKLLNLQEQERRYLCRELHDELGQNLAGLSAVAHTLQHESKGQSPALQSSAEQVNKITRHMMALVKGVLLRLRPADLDELGLKESLRGLVDQWNSKHPDIECDLHMEGDERRVSHSVAVNVLRIAQECLTNISKHSSGSQAEIDLHLPSSHSNGLTLTIEDNGSVGESRFKDQPGIGLLGIRERVSALNGELQRGTTPQGGLAIHIQIPNPSGRSYESH